MRPDLAKAGAVPLLALAAASIGVLASSWPVVVVSLVVGLLASLVVVRRTPPIEGVGADGADAVGRAALAPGAVLLVDRKGVAHTQLAYHRVASFRVAGSDGHVATCAKLPATPFPLRVARVDVDGEQLRLRRRRARHIDVLEAHGAVLVSLLATKDDEGRRTVRAVAPDGVLLHDAPPGGWVPPGFVAEGRAAVTAQAVVLAGVDAQLRTRLARFLSGL